MFLDIVFRIRFRGTPDCKQVHHQAGKVALSPTLVVGCVYAVETSYPLFHISIPHSSRTESSSLPYRSIAEIIGFIKRTKVTGNTPKQPGHPQGDAPTIHEAAL